MITTVRKLFWIWDSDREEKWLNEMAAKGLVLHSVGFVRYDFEESLPGEYSVRMCLLDNSPNNPESAKYIEFVEETGAEHVGSFRNWAYFRKKKALGEFELISDLSMRVGQIDACLPVCLLACMVFLCCTVLNVVLYISVRMFLNLVAACFSAALFALTARGTFKLFRKKRQLKNDADLFE